MSKKQNEIKSKQLGVNFSTACNQLRKSVMFSLVQKCGLNLCHRCGKEIETSHELSLDHVEDWMYKENAQELFFDVNNIAFSHKTCNYGARQRLKGGKSSKSKFKGVVRNDRNPNRPWRAQICENRKCISIGTFKTEIEAAQAYDKTMLAKSKESVTNEKLGRYN